MAKKRSIVDLSAGIFVIVGIACLAWLSISLGKVDIRRQDMTRYFAEFSSVAGLRPDAAVEIAGVPVGNVASIAERDYKAVVALRVRRGIALPDDTIASVQTRGLIGDKFINLSPGASSQTIPPGGRIRETEPAVDLEGLLGAFIHGSANSAK